MAPYFKSLVSAATLHQCLLLASGIPIPFSHNFLSIFSSTLIKFHLYLYGYGSCIVSVILSPIQPDYF